MLPFQIVISKTPHSFLFIMTGQVAKSDILTPILQIPPLLYLIASLHNLTPINTPLLLSFFILLLLFFFLQPTEKPPREPPPLASLSTTITKYTTFNLSPSLVKTGHSFWIGAVFLLWRQRLRVGTLLLDWDRTSLRWTRQRSLLGE